MAVLSRLLDGLSWETSCNIDDLCCTVMNEAVLLIGYYCLEHPENAESLSWGVAETNARHDVDKKSLKPTVLQQLCGIPEVYVGVVCLNY